MKKLKLFLIIFSCLSLIGYSQRWQDENVGMYPNAIQLTSMPRNTSLGIRYSHLFEKPFYGMPVGLYASFSHTIRPDTRFINYDWERRYVIGGTLTLPYDPHSMHTMVTVGLVRNGHPILNQDKWLLPGQHQLQFYETTDWDLDVGVQVQQKHFSSHLTVGVVNFMRYVEFGFGYAFAVK